MVGPPASYEVLCPCGRAVRGERQARHQVIACPGCGRGVFVLPRSPFDLAAPTIPAAPPTPLHTWRGPLVAAGVCLAVLMAGFSLALPYLWREKDQGEEVRPGIEDTRDPLKLLEEGRLALSQGRFRVARQALDGANRLRGRRRDALPAAKARELDQLVPQAALLARLSPRSIEEIVRHATLVRDPAEWESQFDDYRDRAVLFDDAVRRDAAGDPVLAHHVVEVGGEVVRLALGDLSALRNLPLDDAPRMIFGARLARCLREEGGGWVVRFDPGSGVLLTDLAAVEACYPTPLDPEVKATLARQARWLDERDGGSAQRKER